MSDPMSQLNKQLETDPAFNLAFNVAFDAAMIAAKSHGLTEFADYNITNFSEYIAFYSDTLTWQPSEDVTGTEIYHRLCLFYFVLDMPGFRQFQSSISPSSVQPWKWLSNWLVTYSHALGLWMDSPGSFSPATMATFYNAPADPSLWHMWDYPKPSPIWNTFNDFFARHIDPAVRPISGLRDPTVIVSPADSHFDISYSIDTSATITVPDINSKGVVWSIGELLESQGLGETFANGQFMHSFLNANDYHRMHSPVAGVVKGAPQVLQGLNYLQVTVGPDPFQEGKKKLGMRRTLENQLDMTADDNTGYQFLQARGLVLIDTGSDGLGLVAVLPIGMAQVSSVMFTEGLTDGTPLTKGQEIAYFQFGGSDIVVVFQEQANVSFAGNQPNQRFLFGSQIATAKPTPPKQAISSLRA